MSWLDTLEDIRKKDFSKATPEERDKAARDVVNMASYACAVVAISPVPFSDAVLMLPMQSAMVMTVGHVYGRKVTQADAKELLLELGATAGVGMLARQGIKALLPVVGALLTVPAAFAMNWAIGRVAMEYFRSPGMTRDQLKKVYEQAKDEGSKLFSRERFDAFRKSKSAPTPAAAPEETPANVKTTAAKKKSTAAKRGAAKKKRGPATKSAVAKIIEDDFPHRLEAHPEVRAAVAGVIRLDITGPGGGRWTVDMRKASDWISPGFDGVPPKLTVRCGAEDFVALVKGKKNVQLAVMSGDLTLDPMDLDLAAKLGPLFG
jgi:uncharacterized protein (DUF697 family)